MQFARTGAHLHLEGIGCPYAATGQDSDPLPRKLHEGAKLGDALHHVRSTARSEDPIDTQLDELLENGGSDEQKASNAYFLNQIGTHYFGSRSYRDAFRFMSQAADLEIDESAYLMNALRVLVEIDAYQEAYDWLQPRLTRYGDDLVVRSWDAWLAYQNDDTDKAVRIYEELFREGYREDDEFTLYVGLLADREEWDQVEAEFAGYAADI